MNKAIRIAVILALLAGAGLFVGTSPAGGIGQTAKVTVSGDSTPSDCNEGVGAGAIELTGDLAGCLTFFPERFKCQELNGFARYKEWGTETFKGTLHGKYGEFDTTYKLEATYTSGSCKEFNAGGFPFMNQLTGGCDHRIMGTSGAFKGVRGLLTFFDVIPDPGESGASNFLYRARLRVPK